MKSSALVTGGAGFIGSHLCDGLLSEGYQVRVLDDLSTGKTENIPTACDFIQGSIAEESVARKALSGVDVVFHEAARVTIRGSVDHFLEDAQTNLMGTLQLLKASAACGVHRFILASSMAVYSDSKLPQPVPEDHPMLPASPYGIAKLAAEQYLALLAPSLKLEPVILRYFNTFGSRQTFTPYVGVITIFTTHLIQRKPLTIFGDGQQRRDFVHVSDIVQANIRAASVSSAAGNIFNVGTGRGTSVLELAEMLKAEIDSAAEIQYEPARTEELRNSIADISMARRVLGYEPQTDFRKQLPEVIDSVKRRLDVTAS